jgi:hypothetical protein
LLQSANASFNVVAAAGLDDPMMAAASAAAIGNAMDMRISACSLMTQKFCAWRDDADALCAPRHPNGLRGAAVTKP